jgi:hypothetical protein
VLTGVFYPTLVATEEDVAEGARLLGEALVSVLGERAPRSSDGQGYHPWQ